MNKKSLLALALTLALASSAHATILNVPSDYATIQGAIDASADGDTVLVAPGTYYENIYIAGKNITVTGDRREPENVVIDGNSNGSVVTFDGAPIDSTTSFSGFSIQGGRNVYGGGLLLFYSHPKISNLIIANNEAVDQDGSYHGMGGGIFCMGDNPDISNAVIIENSAVNGGGGIGCVLSDPTLTNVEIINNHSDMMGGGLRLDGSNVSLVNVTLCNNNADSVTGTGSIFFYNGASATLKNSILWNNSPNEIQFYPDAGPNGLAISYSDLMGGQEGIVSNDNGEVTWGEGNIDSNPLFVDADNGDFHLQAGSPCIDTGDPNSDNDPDGSRADMGAYYFHQGQADHVLNVPDEYGTIQAAIDASVDGDTVLVAPGTYYENIDFIGKAISVIGSPDNPSEVVIDGSGNGAAVTLRSGESEGAVLTGFTITGGSGSGIYCAYSRNPKLTSLNIIGNSGDLGGGIHCFGSDIEMEKLRIIDNTANSSGGGLFLQRGDYTLSDVVIYGNTVSGGGGGGGIWFGGEAQYRAYLNIRNAVISNNSARESAGGGLAIGVTTTTQIINSTICYNEASLGGGIDLNAGLYSGSVTMVNDIVWGNTPSQFNIRVYGSIPTTYSDIEGGYEGDGNIDSDPQFVDPDNGDFNLQANSPCIDAGDPNSPEDPDGTRADMGAYWYAGSIQWVEKPDMVNVDENECVEFNVLGASSDENAALTITYHSDDLPEAATFEDHGDGSGTFSWQTTYVDSGNYTAHFALFDGAHEVTADVPIRVNDVVIAPRLPTWLISIKAGSGFYNSGDCYVGGAEFAGYGYDPSYDFIAPPTPPGGYVDAYFPHPDWENELGDNYRSDVYPVDCDLNGYAIWDFEVNTNQRSRWINLDILPDSLVRATSNIYLHDRSNDSLQNLRRISRYRYCSAADGGTRSFQLLVGTGELTVSQEISNGWNLISFPRNPLDPTTGRVIGDDITSIYYLYNYSNRAGYMFADSVQAGRGYWLGMNYDAELDVQGGTALEYRRALTPGWQLIGCPYDRPVAFNRAKFLSYGRWYSFAVAVQRGLIQDLLYGFTEGDGGYTDGDTLNPWRGYWISAGSLTVTMSIPPPEGVLPELDAIQPQAFIASSDNWKLEIFAALSNGYDDRLTRLGVEPDATNGFDSPYDCPEPPAPPGGNYVTAYFQHQGWSDLLDDRFNTDFRGALQNGETQTWDLTVETNSAGEVTLSWENLLATTPDYEFYLKDIMAGTEFSLYDAATYKYISDGICEFSIRTVAVSSGRRSGETLPGEFALRSIHPNPFNAATTITCDLPEAASVTLSAYDLGGREVAAIYNGKLTAGRQRILWDASGLSSGIYLVKLQSAGNIRTARVALVR